MIGLGADLGFGVGLVYFLLGVCFWGGLALPAFCGFVGVGIIWSFCSLGLLDSRWVALGRCISLVFWWFVVFSWLV